MQGKIALEEHFSNEEFLGDIKQYFIREGKWDKGSCNIWHSTKDCGRRYNIGVVKPLTFVWFCSTISVVSL